MNKLKLDEAFGTAVCKAILIFCPVLILFFGTMSSVFKTFVWTSCLLIYILFETMSIYESRKTQGRKK